ncbi:MAG: heat-inducible transcriptional repressor HrcA [Candidatus Enteromonas sp.]|jgi:heat-inducible transcriptional repressor|nr:heat-inducible transcription repressor HrcA [Bacilli bacterium]MEE3426387.1 heat-inducible transcriptional repressor HrcA [Candidatus Enteromonas sp.]MBQ2052879.1 heat-inducible transcription repressor HrcA [Bacilli bacterium]MBQ4183299.1 heat-inducible transcription repressor HrcA [Bacilli bacterium]MEE3431352.1 heat-inducible transcriptional repressor HrcA [Candidatus Enteromonas sp.]
MTREETILKLIVEHFIKTAQPVGSQTLLEEYHLPYSSATIRAEMNALEKQGFLEKTHTSSGRVPSGAGYTYYVERLREDSVDEEVKYALQSILDEKSKSVEEVMKESCEILSHMTNLASVVLGPKAEEEHLLSVQVIPLNEKTATAVFVTDRGYVENKTFILDEGLSIEDVTKTVVLLNDRLKGTSISDLVPKMEAMKPALKDYIVGHDMVYQAILRAFVRFAGERIKLYGKNNLFETPEFTEDAKKLKRVLELVDDPEAMRRALAASTKTGDEGVNVSIGDAESGLEDVAILSAEVKLPGEKKTAISLLGPTRMDYERAMGLLDYVSKTLDQYFNESERKGDSECQKKKPEQKKQRKSSPKKK